jgi:ubiquitin C-terminal hydrolase
MKGYYDSEKNNREVRFDECINVEEESTRRGVDYKLVGVVHHLGTLNRGHYYADVRVNNEWFEMDDDKVTPARMSALGNYSKSVYMLIYQRV